MLSFRFFPCDAMLVWYYSHRGVSVRLSIHPSFRLSHASIVSKWLNVANNQGLWFSDAKGLAKFKWGHPQVGLVKIGDF